MSKKYTRYNFRNDKLFHIKMSKLNTNIKCYLFLVVFFRMNLI